LGSFLFFNVTVGLVFLRVNNWLLSFLQRYSWLSISSRKQLAPFFFAQQLADIRRFIRRVKQFVTTANGAGPIFIATFSLVSPWVLKYENWPEKDPVDGYIFLSSGTVCCEWA
jgi:hypothetical protein